MKKSKKRYYRAKELAEYLAIGVSTVWAMEKANKISSIKLSKRVTVFDIEEIENSILKGM